VPCCVQNKQGTQACVRCRTKRIKCDLVDNKNEESSDSSGEDDGNVSADSEDSTAESSDDSDDDEEEKEKEELGRNPMALVSSGRRAGIMSGSSGSRRGANKSSGAMLDVMAQGLQIMMGVYLEQTEQRIKMDKMAVKISRLTAEMAELKGRNKRGGKKVHWKGERKHQ
jgi:hypothetical protein